MNPIRRCLFQPPSRRSILRSAIAFGVGGWASAVFAHDAPATQRRAQIAITLDLEMSREYPRRDVMEWDYEKGNLDEPTKRYAVDAARLAKQMAAKIHFFCVGRVLEQRSVEWLKEIAADGHPVGNHTYDHVFVLAKTPDELQFRFQRAPWLIEGKTVPELIRENIRWTTKALKTRAGITANGFRTPGGFQNGLTDREDVQKLLLEEGFSWVSSKYPPHPTGKPKTEPTDEILEKIVLAQQAAQPFVYPSGLIEIPMSPISDVNAFRSNHWKLEWFLRAIEAAVRWTIEHGAVFDFLAHPSCLVVEDPGMESIRLICRLAKEAGDRAQIVGLDEIAQSMADQAVRR